jgi:putative effector of murein hydrolase
MFKLPKHVLLPLYPKSTTSAVSTGIIERLHGSTSLTAVFSILSSLIGASLLAFIFNLIRIKSIEAKGFSAGLSSAGFGTAQAFQINKTAGAFASLGMALNGILTAILVPLLLFLIH